MSYCRWSSDDFQCDVYCYADCAGGYTTYVADYRHVFDEELPPPVPFEEDCVVAWAARHVKVMEIVGRSKLVKIGLPYDGETFNDETAKEAAERLLMLRAAGYRVPQYAILALLEEGGEA